MVVVITHDPRPPQIVLSLPSPPTVNTYYRSVVLPTKRGYRAAVILSSAARTFKKRVAAYCAANGIRPLDGALAVHIDWYRPRKVGDIENILKGLCDALQGFAYHDDRQIEELYVRRLDDKDRPRVEVAVVVIRGLE